MDLDEIVAKLRARATKITYDLPDVVVGFEAACELADLYTAAANLIEKPAAVNINDYVWVRLTGFGWKVFDDNHRALGLDPAPYRAIIGAPDGWQRFQLWHLMEVFGPHCHLGLDSGFFDRQQVWFKPPPELRPTQKETR